MVGGGARGGERRRPVPLDEAGLRQLALDHVARYATTRARLAAYLSRKLRERGWGGADDPDPVALAGRLADMGYVDDAAFARARTASLARRGYGRMRVAAALYAAGIGEDDRAEALAGAADGWEAALAFARRRRIGPFASDPPDPDGRRRAIAAMIRAGHDLRTARAIVATPPGYTAEKPED